MMREPEINLEFFEFVMPALDMYEDGSDLVVLIDLPGFSKQDISLRILENVAFHKCEKAKR